MENKKNNERMEQKKLEEEKIGSFSKSFKSHGKQEKQRANGAKQLEEEKIGSFLKSIGNKSERGEQKEKLNRFRKLDVFKINWKTKRARSNHGFVFEITGKLALIGSFGDFENIPRFLLTHPRFVTQGI